MTKKDAAALYELLSPADRYLLGLVGVMFTIKLGLSAAETVRNFLDKKEVSADGM